MASLFILGSMRSCLSSTGGAKSGKKKRHAAKRKRPDDGRNKESGCGGERDRKEAAGPSSLQKPEMCQNRLLRPHQLSQIEQAQSPRFPASHLTSSLCVFTAASEPIIGGSSIQRRELVSVARAIPKAFTDP
jgi:hypothetical protein